MRVVDAIARWFEVAGFKHYFGYAGGAVWPFLDALTDKPAIEGIQAKHESHAVHMADLYHRVSNRVAPVIVSKGPKPFPVPNFVGLTLKAAKQEAASLGLVVRNTYAVPGSGKPSGQVQGQNPPEGTPVRKGTAVDFYYAV